MSLFCSIISISALFVLEDVLILKKNKCFFTFRWSAFISKDQGQFDSSWYDSNLGEAVEILKRSHLWFAFLLVLSLPKNHWHKSIWSSRIRTMRTLRTAIITADCDSTLVCVDVRFAFRVRGDFAPGRRRRREERDKIYTSLQSQCMSLKAGVHVAIPLLSHLPRRPGKPDSDLIYLPCLSAPAFPSNGEHKAD